MDYVVGRQPEHLRNIVLMIAVPLLIARGKTGLFLFFYLGTVWLFCLNPLLAHRWMENILALNYFRLVYLLQLPLLCAMIGAAVPRLAEWPGNSLKNWLVTEAALLAIILSFFYSYRILSIMWKAPKAGFGWKSPNEYQLIPANTDFARAAGKYIAHSKLLAPAWTASCELPLLFPKMKTVAPREVTHYFANAGNPKEGWLRRQAQVFVEAQKDNDPKRIEWLAARFRLLIESGRANAVAVPESESAEGVDHASIVQSRLASCFGGRRTRLDVARGQSINQTSRRFGMQEIECCLSDLEVMQDRAAHEGIKSGLRIAQAISVLGTS